MKHLTYLVISGFIYASSARIMTYNILNYQDDNEREDHYIEIVSDIDPNLIVVQELIGNNGYENFKTDVLDVIDPTVWSSALFTNQSAQQDIALYYHHDIFTFVETNAIPTAQSSGTRDVIEWVMNHTESNVQFYIYGAHLKASSGSSNAQQRLEETTVLREHLNNLSDGSYFILAGDLNIYSNNSSSEPCFDMLTGSTDNNNGRLFDPIDRIGNWHNNSSYSDVHTQSPRTSSFGGGANGGMDDRFDWLLVSESILTETSQMYYIEDSYTAFGNDGNHFNDAINSGNNSAVSNEMADALHDASDHLPVYMDIWYDDLVYSDEIITITEVMPNPASVSDSYGEWFEIHNNQDTAINISNWVIKSGNNEEHVIYNNNIPIIVQPDEYFVLGKNQDFEINGGLVVNYEYNNISLSNNEDQIILINSLGAIIDEIYFTSSWAYDSGVSMEVHDTFNDNSIASNWYSSTLVYGDGDNGSPGTYYNGFMKTSLDVIPESFFLDSPFPNPFNPKITFQFYVPNKEFISIEIFDNSGRLIHTMMREIISPGEHSMSWNAINQSSGVYFIKFTYQNKYSVKKVILIK